MPHDTTTRDGYRTFLEQCGNSPSMVAEILAVYFPEPPTAPPAATAPPATRRAPATTRRTALETAGQLTLDT